MLDILRVIIGRIESFAFGCLCFTLLLGALMSALMVVEALRDYYTVRAVFSAVVCLILVIIYNIIK